MFSLIHTHKWDLNYIDNLIPWERDILLSYLSNLIEVEELRRKNNPVR